MNALFLGTSDDKAYLPHLKSSFNGYTTYVVLEPFTMLSQLEIYCAQRKIDKVVSTNTAILSKLLEREGNITSSAKLSNYAGSLFSYKNLEIVFIHPLRQLFTVSYGKFIADRFISKVVAKDSWSEPSEFKWALLTPTNIEDYYVQIQSAIALGTDIETFKHNLAIRCIGYTGVFIERGTNVLTTISLVLPIDTEWALAWMRKINSLPIPKIFQNGKYDNAYLLRYNAPPNSWYWDTAHLFHSWYSELPKDLAFLNAFFLRKVVYWKDLAETNDLQEYYRYNALDTWATANVWLRQLEQMPEWAKRNYLLEFPLVYPCLLSELTGLKRDTEKLDLARKELDTEINKQLSSLRKMINSPNFNPNSPVQVKTLMRILGCGDIADSSDETHLKKAMFRHPLNARIFSPILEVRGLRKLKGTYLRTDEDAKQTGIHAGEGGSKDYAGRILYSLDPHRTDTGRLGSGESAFWVGANIQNIPVRDGPVIRQTIRADDGFYLAECDLEQAESRDTAHIAGDERLISAVSGEKDFHSANASAFFGKPYDTIYDSVAKKTKDKKLRDLAKRVNHGANYNMGPAVLVDTMGLDNIYEANRILKLGLFDPLDVAKYLLERFHATYPILRGPKTPFAPGTYYSSICQEVIVHRRITSRAFHHTEYNLAHYKPFEYIEQGDWTRYCFGKPDKNKSDLNAYVAHAPQSLNARTLNEAYMKVFYEVALPNPESFRLHAQIHDSILFSYRPDMDHLPDAVRQAMEIPVTVRDISGTHRTFTVPAALKIGKLDKSTGALKRAVYWSETE
jgi:DNA polymerase I-like protein with 3'-5' exonuclease and polymerase domains